MFESDLGISLMSSVKDQTTSPTGHSTRRCISTQQVNRSWNPEETGEKLDLNLVLILECPVKYRAGHIICFVCFLRQQNLFGVWFLV